MTKKIIKLYTRRELEVLLEMNQGLTSNQIAEKLEISPLTVGTFRKRIMKKSDCHNVFDILKYCRKNRIRA